MSCVCLSLWELGDAARVRGNAKWQLQEVMENYSFISEDPRLSEEDDNWDMQGHVQSQSQLPHGNCKRYSQIRRSVHTKMRPLQWKEPCYTQH